MKALVLSGGAGTRLRPFSYSMPKQLIPVANKSVLEHVLANIADLSVTEAGIVVGDRAPEIMAAIGDGRRFGLKVEYIRQDAPLGLAHCVRLVRNFLGDDDFVLHLGDNMLPEGVKSVADAFRAGRPDAQLVVHPVRNPEAFGIAELNGDGTLLRLVEKPRTPAQRSRARRRVLLHARHPRGRRRHRPQRAVNWRSPMPFSGCSTAAPASRSAGTPATGARPGASRTCWSATGTCWAACAPR
ncbi:Glucose-1-phosphate thymidylyltransferase 1 [Streptomyces sp. MP131-18]|nr:Glucose-1-phosphate thymidylyltransferase 1 [Streptomyces sp. MP131-18]